MPLKQIVVGLTLLALAACGTLPAGTIRQGSFSSDFPGLTTALYANAAANRVSKPCGAGSTGGRAGVPLTAETTELGLTNLRIETIREC